MMRCSLIEAATRSASTPRRRTGSSKSVKGRAVKKAARTIDSGVSPKREARMKPIRPKAARPIQAPEHNLAPSEAPSS